MKSVIRRAAGLLARTFTLTLAFTLAACNDSSSSSDTVDPTPIVVVAPSITTSPAAATLQEGASASFSVVASGTAPLTYQWQRDGAAIAGATGATLSVPTLSIADSGAQFRVVVSNSAGSATSSPAALTVLAVVVPPTISVQPQSSNSLDGDTATVSVVAAGTAPFTYVWRRNGSVIVDATGDSYTTPALTLADSGAVYSVLVANSAGSVSSGSATLTVNPVVPAVTTAPLSVAVGVGQSATFTANAAGSAPLAYQWLRNGAAIAGATGNSYVTPVTALADNGTRFSVRVSNAGGTVTSGEAVLSVSATVAAPAIATAPASVSVQEGQTATFSIGATGTAPLAYQWLRNGVALAGATAASYTTAAALLADNGAAFSVRVANSVGTATSASAVLTVTAATSPLIGRAWATAQSLESDDSLVTDVHSTIDDAGRATVVFRKYNGTRNVMYATRGTPNAAGAAPTWSTPVAIDLLAGVPVSTMDSIDFAVTAAPGGNVAAYWYHRAPCTLASYFANVTGTCQYFYSARYLIASNTWEAPVLMGDSPTRGYDLRINDRGDIAALGAGWVRSGTTGSTATKSVFMRPAASATFSRSTFAVGTVANPRFDLDGAGNLLVAAEASQNATVDLVAYRGNVSTGLGAAQVLDTRGAAATLRLAGVGVNGQQVVVWSQNNGTADTSYAATAASATAAFAVQDLGYKLNTSVIFHRLTISDSGQAIVYDFTPLKRLRWTAATGWTGTEALPSTLPHNPYFYGLASARSGDIVAVQLGGPGDWSSYDARRNVMVQPPLATTPGPGFVLGLSKNAGYEDLNFSQGGTAIVTLKNQFDVLPTPAAPAGDGRTVTNLWGAFLK